MATLPSFYEMLSLAALVCGGITAASQPGGILSGPYTKLDQLVRRGLFPQWLAKPMLLCDTCMASFWGIPMFVLWCLGETVPRWIWTGFYGLAFVCGLAMVNYALWTILSTFRAIRDHANARRDP